MTLSSKISNNFFNGKTQRIEIISSQGKTEPSKKAKEEAEGGKGERGKGKRNLFSSQIKSVKNHVSIICLTLGE